MNKDTIIRLAREVGLWEMLEGYSSEYGSLDAEEDCLPDLERFAALVEAHLKEQGYRQCAKGQKTTQFCGMVDQAVWAEREACAQVCEEKFGVERIALECAAAIRSRT